MDMKKTFATAAAVGLISLGGAVISDDASAMEMNDKEKCYGVVKAGANDCGANGHSCAGQAEYDADPSEWAAVPKGLCDRLAGGSTEPDSNSESEHGSE